MFQGRRRDAFVCCLLKYGYPKRDVGLRNSLKMRYCTVLYKKLCLKTRMQLPASAHRYVWVLHYHSIANQSMELEAQRSALARVYQLDWLVFSIPSAKRPRMRKQYQVITPHVVFSLRSTPLPDPFLCPSTIQTSRLETCGWPFATSLSLSLPAARSGCHYFLGFVSMKSGTLQRFLGVNLVAG